MYRPKINQIVEITTPTKREKYGTGIIVSTTERGAYSVRVIFADSDFDYRVHDFKPEHLKAIEAAKGIRRRVRKLAHYYRIQADEMKIA